MPTIAAFVKERWNAIKDAAGIRWQVFGLLIAIAIARLDWFYRRSGGVEDMIFGFPSWILGITVALALLFVWMLESNVQLRCQIKVARLEIARLRLDGVRLRNAGRRTIDSATAWLRWQCDVLDWNDRVVAAIAKINEGDAAWFAVLDVVPESRVAPQAVSEEFKAEYEKLFREHDFRVRRLGDMISALWGTGGRG
jgi:hypothetical protein